jgi:hypothetical protein
MEKAARLAIADEIPGDEEISAEAEAVDDVELVFDAAAGLGVGALLIDRIGLTDTLLVLAAPGTTGQVAAIVLGALVGWWTLRLDPLPPGPAAAPGVSRRTGAVLLLLLRAASPVPIRQSRLRHTSFHFRHTLLLTNCANTAPPAPCAQRRPGGQTLSETASSCPGMRRWSAFRVVATGRLLKLLPESSALPCL